MKIAIVNEASSADKNPQIVDALSGFGHEIINVGMRSTEEAHKLNYLHIGLLTGVLINAGIVDLVVGGCGTGHGYCMAAMQFPGVYCSTVYQPLDAWLSAQINNPNCLSLAYNKGYGWGSDVNMRFLFERFFEVEPGGGYPAHRREPQKEGKRQLIELSRCTHRSMAQILLQMDRAVARHALGYPGVRELLNLSTMEDAQLKSALETVYAG